MDNKDLRQWVEASHTLFDLYEGQPDTYSVSRRWIDEWLDSGRFKVTPGDREAARLLRGRDFSLVGIDAPLWKSMCVVLDGVADGILKQSDDAGLAAAPYLLTWNIRRYAHFQRSGVSPIDHFEKLGHYLDSRKGEIKDYRSRHILDSAIDGKEVTDLFQQFSDTLTRLGDGRSREAVGAAKLMHILAPYYFPLIDKSIAEAVLDLRPKDFLSPEDYLAFMERLKNMLEGRSETARELEAASGKSILKLVDEGLYLMCSVKLEYRVGMLGLQPLS